MGETETEKERMSSPIGTATVAALPCQQFSFRKYTHLFSSRYHVGLSVVVFVLYDLGCIFDQVHVCCRQAVAASLILSRIICHRTDASSIKCASKMNLIYNFVHPPYVWRNLMNSMESTIDDAMRKWMPNNENNTVQVQWQPRCRQKLTQHHRNDFFFVYFFFRLHANFRWQSLIAGRNLKPISIE